ncbi:MAG TPA: iron-containing alcohol dehydrogenase [Solirubrobacteraceae bacterium]|nr:iron-containing alcohol dehydrogenase [Solirubrobacteraceae bacterium]
MTLPEEELGGRQMRGFKDFYQFTVPTRVIAGRALIEGLGFELSKEGARRVAIVTDEVIRGTGLVDKVVAGVEDGGLEVAGIFDGVPPDSDSAVVASAAGQARAQGADAFLAVGGGSVMDTAKLADVIFTHGGEPRDWEGYYGLPREDDGLGRPLDLAPLGCVPTTAGTGSESSFAAVIKDREEHLKFQVADFPMYPRLAVLDPESTRTLPPAIAAATGMDALTHAIEGYVSREWTPHGDAYALHALRLIRDNLERAVQTPEDEDARGNMLIAANLAIAPTSCNAIGIAHSLSHPAGAHFDVPHGVANAIHLPVVIEFNAAGGSDIADRYRDINELLGLEPGGDDETVGQTLAEHVRGLVANLGLPTRLSEVGVPESAVPALVEGAMGDACTLVNPREPTEEEFAALYERAL